MKRILLIITVIYFIVLNLNCSIKKTKDWSFLELINFQLVIEQDCQVEIFNSLARNPPQKCFALISDLDFYKWENERILSSNEVAIVKDIVKKSEQKKIPTQILKNYSKGISQKEYIKLVKLGKWNRIFDDYNVSKYAMISNPTWVDSDLVLIFINTFDRNEFASGGEIIIFRKINSIWKTIYQANTWIS